MLNVHRSRVRRQGQLSAAGPQKATWRAEIACSRGPIRHLNPSQAEASAAPAGLVALFFGGAFGTRLAMVLDEAITWLEVTLIWTFALVLVVLLGSGVLAEAATLARGVVQSNPIVANTGMMRAAGWLAFAGTILAWIVTVAGSFWGRAQARDRARTLRLAA
jgi:hypothetical protein